MKNMPVAKSRKKIPDITIGTTTTTLSLVDGLPSCWGEIIINDFKEKFIMSLDSWSLNDYQQQWREGLAKIHQQSQSCLVTSAQNLTTKPLVNWWVLYRHGDTIFIQNHLLFGKRFATKLAKIPFTPATCYDYIPPRETISDDGTPISEWSVKVDVL